MGHSIAPGSGLATGAGSGAAGWQTLKGGAPSRASVKPSIPAARNTGFWGLVERGILRLQHDPEARASAFKWSWIISVAFTFFGFVVIFRVLF